MYFLILRGLENFVAIIKYVGNNAFDANFLSKLVGI